MTLGSAVSCLRLKSETGKYLCVCPAFRLFCEHLPSEMGCGAELIGYSHCYILFLQHKLPPLAALNHMPGTETSKTACFCSSAGRCDSISNCTFQGAYLDSVLQVHQAPHKPFLYWNQRWDRIDNLAQGPKACSWAQASVQVYVVPFPCWGLCTFSLASGLPYSCCCSWAELFSPSKHSQDLISSLECRKAGAIP